MVLHSWVEWLKEQQHLWVSPTTAHGSPRESEAAEREEEHKCSEAEQNAAAAAAEAGAVANKMVEKSAAIAASIVHGEPFVERKSTFQVP